VLSTETLQKIADALEVELPDLFSRLPQGIINCPKCGAKLRLTEE
jgi:hypothetical protein